MYPLNERYWKCEKCGSTFRCPNIGWDINTESKCSLCKGSLVLYPIIDEEFARWGK